MGKSPRIRLGRKPTMNAGPRRLFVAFVAVLVMAVIASSASASTDDIIAPSDPDNPTPTSGWQAGTCTSDAPTQCSVATPGQFFELAGGRPQVGFTQFIVRNEQSDIPAPVGGPEEPIGELDSVR